MAWSDLGMGLTVGTLIGMIVAALLGLVFLVSCILSVVKAVRDRREIKARIAARRAGQINGNGHALGADSLSPDEGRRGRPNILIIHDGAREERVKKGTGPASLGSSPRYPSPGISSPEEQNSRHTESTTVAEVCHHSSFNSSPGDENGTDGDRAGGNNVRNGRCLLPGQVAEGDNQDDEVTSPVDICGDSVEYRKRSIPNNCDPSGVVTTFPVSCSLDDEFDSDSGHVRNMYMSDGKDGGRPKGKDMLCRKVSHSSLKYIDPDDTVSDTKETDSTPHSTVPASSTHGFAKNKKSSPHHVAHGVDYLCATSKYNPRRNSYAAAIAADPDWVDLAPVRRHSDDARHSLNSTPPLHTDKLRMRSYSREGADNPAYDAADDKMAT